MSGIELYVWQDREVRFDVPVSALDLRPGEQLIDSIPNVEDTKGNNGDSGSLLVTNLRLIWISTKYPKTNLSIGYNCIVNTSVKLGNTKLKGNTQELKVITKYNSTRFEFIFTYTVTNNANLFTIIQGVHRAYETSKLYRDLKLRGAITRNKELILLPQEQIYNKVNGVWNLSSDQGSLGTFFLTNVRLVWHANLAENFNVSIPFLQMKSIRVRDSKFGLALVIETMPQSGAYVLGFRIDPSEQLYQTAQEIQNIHQVFSANPIFGVLFTPTEEPSASLTALKAKSEQDDVEIVGGDDNTDAFALYYADVNKHKDKEPMFSSNLGLAIETLPEGITLESLWNVV
eukprot:TRINITY_DN2556_c0_g2_i1.p1 TRINITY_DN2556_c0_g2~~TRINITY_DN2556_c0_g2_i1.p1  ORF type:complete len:344 (+),score=41.49 TRINITY_DN2556_c0_g2_i1:263-1294(+)